MCSYAERMRFLTIRMDAGDRLSRRSTVFPNVYGRSTNGCSRAVPVMISSQPSVAAIRSMTSAGSPSSTNTAAFRTPSPRSARNPWATRCLATDTASGRPCHDGSAGRRDISAGSWVSSRACTITSCAFQPTERDTARSRARSPRALRSVASSILRGVPGWRRHRPLFLSDDICSADLARRTHLTIRFQPIGINPYAVRHESMRALILVASLIAAA